VSVALTPTSSGVSRMPLSDALELGPAAWTSPSPFMSWAWHRAWADAASPVEVAETETLVLHGADGTVRALLPLARRRVLFRRAMVSALTWAVGDMGCPDHLDVPAQPGAPVDEFVPAIEVLPWELMVLSNLVAGAETTWRLCEAFQSRGYEVRRQPLWPCPYLDLPSNWDGYLGSLTPTRRQTLRRKERHLLNHGMIVTDYPGDRVDEGLEHLFALHARRWETAGEGGAFEDPSVQRLHRRFAAELAAQGRLWLSTLDISGQPVAAWYGFASGDTVYFYQSGRDTAWERYSVGLVLMGTMIRRAIEGGYRRFDFLRGADPYKQHWTSTQCMTEEVTVFRRGFGGRMLRALDTLGGLRERLWRKTERH